MEFIISLNLLLILFVLLEFVIVRRKLSNLEELCENLSKQLEEDIDFATNSFYCRFCEKRHFVRKDKIIGCNAKDGFARYKRGKFIADELGRK